MAIKSINSFRDIHDWIEHLRNELPLSRVIPIVKQSLAKATGDDHRYLGGELSWLLREAGRDAEALRVLDQLLKQHPEDVRPALSKSGMYLLLDQLEEALKSGDVALERAHRSGLFRREALGNKARILLKLGRPDEFSDVLEEIMSLQIAKGIPDIGRERDFIDRAPPGFIPRNVLERYNEFRPKRVADTSAEEPPEYEPPDDAS